ncbi:MAG TPA: class I SAM-dependent methyltransferase [Cyclobacteriaceae bacterium]|nr:class I SAM-dependent methyltransferase [Cyclobacteriaceae bacterium]
MRQREKVVPQARGSVLEIGIGSGLNLPFYDSTKVTKIWGLDPSPEMIKLAEQMARSLHLEVEFIGLPADEIQLDDGSIDTVLITYTLCSILDTTPALRQMARVLRPGGELIFCEHGAAPDANVRRWQNHLNPIWKQFAGGCNLNRPIPDLIEAGGFRINALETMYIPGWRPACFNYWGIAVPR